MMHQKKYFAILFFLLMLIPSALCSQEQPKRDSMYQKIERFSEKSKSLRLLYRLMFRNAPDTVNAPSTNFTPISKVDHEGKFIRKIIIKSYDPLGYSDNDEKKKWYEQLGNYLHNNSKSFAIRGYLLFKKGEIYNQQKLYESERLLRTMSFVNRASIYPLDSSATKDSVDIAVRIIDSWSLKPNANYSAKKLGFGITEENFMGMGHVLELQYKTNLETKQFSYLGSYRSNNIYGTYINAGITGERDFDRNENVIFNVNRDFFSPLTRWAGGITLNYFKKGIQIPTFYGIHPENFPWAVIKVQNQNFWGGYQFQLQNSREKEVTENLIVSARFENYVFVEAPPYQLDPHNYFGSHNIILGSLGYNQRKFKVLKNAFQYDIPEDFPYGKAVFLTGGVRKDFNRTSYPYLGISAGYGDVGRFGFFNVNAQFGSYIRNKNNYRSTFRIDGTYFTPLQDWNFAYARHFFSPTLVLGNNRSDALADRINLASYAEFPRYSSFYLGENKLILRYQLQLFINKTWKNFHFDPFFSATSGFLSQDGGTLMKCKMNWKFGVGVLFYNPYLAFNRFQFSFAYYPKLPFDEKSGFDVNGFRNYQMPINGFSPNAPSVVGYQ